MVVPLHEILRQISEPKVELNLTIDTFNTKLQFHQGKYTAISKIHQSQEHGRPSNLSQRPNSTMLRCLRILSSLGPSQCCTWFTKFASGGMWWFLSSYFGSFESIDGKSLVGTHRLRSQLLVKGRQSSKRHPTPSSKEMLRSVELCANQSCSEREPGNFPANSSSPFGVLAAA